MIETEPEIAPDEDGAKITEKASDSPGASELKSANPDTVKPCGTLIFVMLKAVLLLFVMLAVCALLVPTTTLPKAMDEGLTEIPGAGFGDENAVAASNLKKAVEVIAIRTTKKHLPKHRGPRSFIGGTSTG